MSNTTSSGHGKQIIVLAIIIGSIFFWSWLLLTYGAEEIISYLGIENGYLVMGLVSLFGGVSSIAGVTYIATIITFAASGFNPIGLAIASGLGVSVGDTIYYLIGKYALNELPKSRLSHLLESLSVWLQDKSKILKAAFIYIYTAFTPLPNDILLIILGAARQPFLFVLPVIVVGNITLTFMIAMFGQFLPHI